MAILLYGVGFVGALVMAMVGFTTPAAAEGGGVTTLIWAAGAVAWFAFFGGFASIVEDVGEIRKNSGRGAGDD